MGDEKQSNVHSPLVVASCAALLLILVFKFVVYRKRRAQRRSPVSKIPVGVLDLDEDESKSKLGSLVCFSCCFPFPTFVNDSDYVHILGLDDFGR